MRRSTMTRTVTRSVSGLTRHWFCRRCRVLSLSWAGTIGKTIYGYAVCKKLNMPYWYPTATASGSYYIPPVGVIPIVTIGANTIDGVPNAGSPICGMVRVRAVVSFKNMKE